MERPIWKIAQEIKQDWKNVNFAAKPYLDAMMAMDKVTDSYGFDSGDSIILYFLSNANSWKEEKAREIKKKLKTLVGQK